MAKLQLVSIAVAVTVATAANAQPFEGPYLGAQGGYGQTALDARLTNGLISFSDEEDETGLVGGVFLGYGTTLGGLYVGAELEGMLSGLERAESGIGYRFSVEQNYTVGFLGRLGYTVTDNVLIYGKAGWAVTEFEAAAAVGPFSASDTGWLHGPRVGGGVELAFGGGLFGRAEYSHTWYRDWNFNEAGFTTQVGGDEDLLMLGIGYRF
jgi:outer membrane immunogenic protein